MHIAHMIKEQYKPTKLSQQNKTHMLDVCVACLISAPYVVSENTRLWGRLPHSTVGLL